MSEVGAVDSRPSALLNVPQLYISLHKDEDVVNSRATRGRLHGL